MEVELKLLVDPKYKDALLQHSLLSSKRTTKPHEQNQSDTYYDTPDLQLRDANIGLRVRHVNGSWVQNIQSGGSIQSGLRIRHEWESLVTGPAPVRQAPRGNATRATLQVGKVGVVSAVTGRTTQFAADRTGNTAKAFSNGPNAALVVAHGHKNGALLCRQMGVDFWHGSTLQQRVLHLVLEAAKSVQKLVAQNGSFGGAAAL